MAHLSLPPDVTENQAYSAYVARQELAPRFLARRSIVDLPGTPAQVRRADQALAEVHARLKAAQPVQVEVKGPSRLEFEARLKGEAEPSAALLLLAATLDPSGHSLALRRLPSGPELGVPLQVDGLWEAAGRLERFGLEIPEGTHRLSIVPSHAVLARLWTVQGPDLLLHRNAPAAWSDGAAAANDEPWVQEALAAATSNRWRGIGATVVQKLLQAARDRPHRQDLLDMATELDSLVGEWNPVPPSDPSAQAGTTPAAVIAAATSSRAPLDPIRGERVVPHPPAAVPRPLTPALFHAVAAQPRHFPLPSAKEERRMRLRVLEPAQAPVVLELRDSNGRIWRVNTGAAVLAPEQMSVDAAALSSLSPGAGPAAFSNLAPSVLQSGEVQWWLPAGASGLTIRAISGRAMVAVDWRGSGDLPLDDGAAAALARRSPADASPRSQPLATLAEAAWQPVERLTRGSMAQLSSGTRSLPNAPSVADAVARGSAARARQERDPAVVMEHWIPVLGAPDPDLRVEALRGQTDALLSAGERFLAEQVLRGRWLGDDPVLAAAAFQVLQALYVRENDDESLLTLTAAAAARDPAHVGPLAVRLSRVGEDRLALAAALASPKSLSLQDKALLPALLTSALRARMPATFAALLSGWGPSQEESALWQGLHALQARDIEAALAALGQAGHKEWIRTVEQAQTIAAGIERNPTLAVVQDWVTWQSAHPGPHHWSPELPALASHGGGLVVRSTSRDLRSSWWRATKQHPLVVQVVGPARLRVEARPLHEKPGLLLEGWLRIEGKAQMWIQPYQRNRISPGLEIDGPEPAASRLGEEIERVIDLPPGVHRLRIHAESQPMAARYQVERPALQATWLLPAPAPAHFVPGQLRVADESAAPRCGLAGACVIKVPEPRLSTSNVSLRQASWPGLPSPDESQDLAAARLAAGDLPGAVQAASNPAEKMRLLAWMAETQPLQRSRAVALAARTRGERADAQLMEAWQRITRSSNWVFQPLVTRSAGLRSAPAAPGAAQSTAGRMRAALLAPMQPGELRLSGDSRVVYSLVDPAPSRTVIHLQAEDLPGLVPLPLTAQVQVSGRLSRRVELPAPGASVSIPVELPAGEHEIDVHLSDSYSNQTLRVRFDGNGAALPELRRDWQIATRTQPVRVTVAAPAWVRIDRLEATGQVRSEERIVEGQGVQTITLKPRCREPESLYRVYLRQPMATASAVPPPRPNRYQPEPVPLPPADWTAVAEQPQIRAIRFEDAVAVDELRDYTWTPRLAVRQRRDTEATGGSTQTRIERFGEAGASWMQRSADGERWRMADAFARAPDRGSPVLGLRLQASRSIGWLPALPLPLQVSSSLFAAAQSTPEGVGVGIQADAALAQSRRLTPRLTHRPEVGAFVRYSNLRDVDSSDLDRIDTDIYSRYRERHRFGLSLGDSLSWQPWRDTEIALRARLVSNENLSADNWRLEVQWQQLAGAWLLGAGIRHTRYLTDRHRTEAIGVTEPLLGVQREHRMADGQRLELRFVVRRDTLTRSVTGSLELQWHQSAGRGLWDRPSGDRDFRELREWRVSPAVHRVEEVR